MRDTPRVFVPPPLIIFGSLGLGLWVDSKLPTWPELVLVPVLVGGGIALMGVALISVALGLFHRASTRPEPWQPSSTLVCGGVYRFTRNPMYLGMLVIYFGISLALRSLAAFVFLVPVFLIIDRIIIPREEAYLRRRFGQTFDRYTADVRRWV